MPNFDVFISTGNTKLGSIPNISLPPKKTCGDVPCMQQCYALKAYNQYPHVRVKWNANFTFYKEHPNRYFQQVRRWLLDNDRRYFRWHVGGDCPDEQYIQQVIQTAILLPSVSFMLFTKRHSWWDISSLPPNLNVIWSMWPYMKTYVPKFIPEDSVSRAWVRGDHRIYTRPMFHCVGLCTDCMKCWTINAKPEDILLKGH